MKKLISIILILVIIVAMGCSNEAGNKIGKEPRKENLASKTCFALEREDLNIGGIYYRQPFAEVVAMYGQPVDKKRGAPKGMIYQFVSNGTKFTVDTDGYEKGESVTYVLIKGNTGLATKAGIQVGSTIDDIIKAYGTPNVDYRHYKPDENGAVRTVAFKKKVYSSANPGPNDHGRMRSLCFRLDEHNIVVAICYDEEDLSC